MLPLVSPLAQNANGSIPEPNQVATISPYWRCVALLKPR
jgi:hypothetical protein